MDLPSTEASTDPSLPPLHRATTARRAHRARECVEEFPKLVGTIHELTNTYRFFLAEFAGPDRSRKRVEAAIAEALSVADKGAVKFQDEGVRYAPRMPEEVPVEVRVASAVRIVGMPEVMTC
jgi:hypothetical protein